MLRADSDGEAQRQSVVQIRTGKPKSSMKSHMLCTFRSVVFFVSSQYSCFSASSNPTAAAY